MTFRDDDQARAARVDSLERENKELREKLAAAETASREHTKPPVPSEPPADTPSSKPRAPEKSTKKQRAFADSFKAVFAILGVITAVALIGRASRAWMPASLRRIELVDGAIVVETTASSRNYRATRLFSFDPASGAELGRVELDRHGTIQWPQSGRRAWYVTRGQASLVDLRTPAVLLQSEALARTVPELAAGFRLQNSSGGTLRSLGGSISDERPWYPSSLGVLLADGREAWLDSQPTLSLQRPANPIEPRLLYSCLYYDAPSCSETRCWAWRREDNRTTEQLGWSPGWRSSTGNDAITMAGPDAARLHSPRFVKTLDRGCVSEIAGGMLVEHRQSALDKAPRSLSLVSREGQLRWTVPLASLLDAEAAVYAAIVQGSRVSLLLGDAAGEQASIRSVSGRRLVLVRIDARGSIEHKQALL